MENYYSLKYILKILKKNTISISLITSLTGIISAYYLYKTPDIYLSSSLVTISGQNNSINRTSSLIQSFTGSSMSSSPDVITNDIVIATAKSRQFVLTFIQNYDLVSALFPKLSDLSKPKQYEIYDKFLNNHLSIVENQANGYLTFNIRHESPKIAYEILSNYIEELDSYRQIYSILDCNNRDVHNYLKIIIFFTILYGKKAISQLEITIALKVFMKLKTN